MRKSVRLKWSLWLLSSFVALSDIHAQELNISGIVSDLKNRPLNQVKVFVVGVSNSTFSDDKGIFSLALRNVKPGQTITVRAVKDGFAESTSTITASTVAQRIFLSPLVPPISGNQKKDSYNKKKPVVQKTKNESAELAVNITSVNQSGGITAQTVIVNNNQSSKVTPLNISKYIDTSKKIYLSFGGNTKELSMSELRYGFAFDEIIGPLDNQSIVLKAIGGEISLDCDIVGFNQYIAKVRNNSSIQTSEILNLYSTDQYLEIFDKSNIPVLQIELESAKNTIYIGGAFNTSTKYLILTKEHMLGRDYGKSKLDMSDEERLYFFKEYQNAAKEIFPIHESKL